MKATIKGKSLSGVVTVPSSKSQVHRALICAALADIPTEIRFYGRSNDIIATADCMRSIGATVDSESFGFRVSPITRNSIIRGAMLRCSESGSTLRFLLPVVAALGADASFFTEGRLSERPLAPLDSLLEDNGCSIVRDKNIISCLGKFFGNSSENNFSIDGGVSSQFISGLLMALPIIGGGRITVTGKCESKGYINMTVDVMKKFSVSVKERDNVYTVSGSYKSPRKLTAEGDWSSATFWATADALGSNITLSGMDGNSLQGDVAALSLLEKMGASFSFNPSDGAIEKTSEEYFLHGIEFDASDIPDAVPAMAVAACGAEGITEIKGASRLRLKESDRLATVSEMISACGGRVVEHDDGLSVYGCGRLSGGRVNAHGDHRIAMSAAVLSLICDGEVVIDGAETVSKSYPDFWNDFAALGGDVILEETV